MGTQKPSGGGGGKSGPGEIRAGGGYFELNLRDKLTKALDKIQSKVKAFGAFMSKVGTTGIAGGAALGAGPLGLLFGGGSRLAGIAQLSRQFQIPIQLMNKFQYAAEAAGVSVDEVMGDTAGRFTDLLAKASPINPAEAEAALKIQTDFKDAIRALQDAMTPLLTVISPIVTEVANFVKENAGAVKVVAAVAAGLTGVGAAFSLLGPAVTLVGSGIGIVGAAFGALLSPVGLAVGAIGGLGYLFATQTKAGQDMTSRIGAGFMEIADVATTAWGGIVAAFQKGDLSAVWDITCKTMQVAWAGSMLFLEERWVWFKSVFVDGFKDAIAGVKLLFWDAMAWIARTFSGVISKVVSAAASLLDAVGLETLSGKLSSLDFSPENINRNRDAIKADIVADRAAGQAEANEAREAGLAAARQRLADAKAALNGAVDAAKAPAVAGGDYGEGGDFEYIPKGRELMMGAAAVKGGFSVSSAQNQFGYGDKVSEQTELMKQLVNGEGKLPDKIGGALANALKLK